jgi:hypothetical protein
MAGHSNPAVTARDDRGASAFEQRGPGPRLLIAFVLLIGTSWIVANPAGYAPDEPAHYTKAIGVGRGELVGKPEPYPIGPGFGPLQLRWINKASRTFKIPPGLSPGGLACSIFSPNETAACVYQIQTNNEFIQFRTYVGTYEPFMYLLPGVAMNRAHNPVTATLLGRIVSGGIALVLLAMAAAVLVQRGSPGSGIGLVGAVTPMVVFLGSALSPAGPELAAAICLTAVVLRLARGGRVPRSVWLAAAGSGAVLVLSRSLGPFLLAAVLGVFLVAAGPRGSARIARRGGWWAWLAGSVILLGVAANLAWGIRVQPSPSVDLESAFSWIGRSVRDMPEVLRQDVGSFGWADVNMPMAAYLAWGAMIGVLVVTAFAVGRARDRLFLGTMILGCFLGTVVIATAVIYQTYFAMYGRYALPLWVIVPLCAGEILTHNRHRLPTWYWRAFLIGVPLVAAAVHATGWYVNARRYAVSETGPLWFFGHSEWHPRGGWEPWVATSILALGSLCAYGVLAARAAGRPFTEPLVGADTLSDGRREARAETSA